MPVNESRFKIGLLLIIFGLGVDILAGYWEPSLGVCNTLSCYAAEDIAALTLLVVILGILVQVLAFTRPPSTAPAAPGLPGAGPTVPTFPGSAAGGPFAPPAPLTPSPASPPPFRAPPTSGPATVQCPRCRATYPVGQFAYCPACGAPLPFTPS